MHVAVLRIISSGIKMRGTVRIRKLCLGKSMRREAVDPVDQHVVRHPLHIGEPLGPAVSAENLTERPALVSVQLVRRRCGKACKCIVIIPALAVIVRIRLQLVKHGIDAAHVLSGHRPVIMPGTGAEGGVQIHVFKHVADIFNTSLFAPVTKLLREILLISPGNNVHVRKPHRPLVSPKTVKQGGEEGQLLISRPRDQFIPYIVCPGKRHAVADMADGKASAHGVVESGLIREETGKNRAEITAVTGIMRLVHSVDQDTYRVLFQEGNVIRSLVCDADLFRIRQNIEMALRNIRPEIAVLNALRNIDTLRVPEGIAILFASCKYYRYYLFRTLLRRSERSVFKQKSKRRCHLKGIAGERSLYAHCLLPEIPPFQMIRCILHRTIGKAGREMGVVEDPDTHALFSGLIHYNIHILPPFGTDKIGMRPCLEADFPDTGFPDFTHIFPES